MARRSLHGQAGSEFRERQEEIERRVLAPINELCPTDGGDEDSDEECQIIEESLLVVKPDAAAHHPAILQEAERAGFMTEATSMVLTHAMAQQIVASAAAAAVAEVTAGRNTPPAMESERERERRLEEEQEREEAEMHHLVRGTALAVVLSRAGAVDALLRLCGPMDPQDAKRSAPDSLRAKFGADRVRNAVHCSPSWEWVQRDIRAVFGYAPRLREVRVRRSGAVESESDSGEEALPVDEQRRLLKQRRRQLAKRQRSVDAAQRSLADRERELHRRLYPTGRGGSTTGLTALAEKINAAPSVPLTAEGQRRLFDDLDKNGNGWLSKQEFKKLYSTTPGYDNPGIPLDHDRLDREMENFTRAGKDALSFDEFSIMLYRIARR